MHRVSVIITAGGVGSRMGASLPKQFMHIHEKPILMYTIERFYHYDPALQLIVTLPENWINYWEELLEEHDFTLPHRIVSGGKERYNSIKNALQFCNREFVAVHDGVRPLVSRETLDRCFDAMKKNAAVVPVISMKESLRKMNGQDSVSVDRSEFVLVQTPQCFSREVLMKAYKKDFSQLVTDDACLVEAMGETIHLVEGNEENIKITTQVDLAIAAHLLR